jgi:hypothetical protein
MQPKKAYRARTTTISPMMLVCVHLVLLLPPKAIVFISAWCSLWHQPVKRWRSSLHLNVFQPIAYLDGWDEPKGRIGAEPDVCSLSGPRGEESLIRFPTMPMNVLGAPNEFVSVRTDVGSLPPAMVPLPSSCQPDAGPSHFAPPRSWTALGSLVSIYRSGDHVGDESGTPPRRVDRRKPGSLSLRGRSRTPSRCR